jgi:hypothetical protein
MIIPSLAIHNYSCSSPFYRADGERGKETDFFLSLTSEALL